MSPGYSRSSVAPPGISKQPDSAAASERPTRSRVRNVSHHLIARYVDQINRSSSVQKNKDRVVTEGLSMQADVTPKLYPRGFMLGTVVAKYCAYPDVKTRRSTVRNSRQSELTHYSRDAQARSCPHHDISPPPSSTLASIV